MEFENRAIIIGVNLRDIKYQPSSPHIFVDVVLIDKSNEILHPLLYKLHSDTLAQQEKNNTFYQSNVLPIEDSAFALVGEVQSVDKEKKIIYLSNNVTVSYKHLIVASGLKQSVLGSAHDQELNAGVNALAEALRVRKNTTEALIFPELNHFASDYKDKAYIKKPHNVSLKSVHNILHQPHIINREKSLNMTLGSFDKRLYQVQL